MFFDSDYSLAIWPLWIGHGQSWCLVHEAVTCIIKIPSVGVLWASSHTFRKGKSGRGRAVGVGVSRLHFPLPGAWAGCVCRCTRRHASATSQGVAAPLAPKRFKYGRFLTPSPHQRASPFILRPLSQVPLSPFLPLTHKHTTTPTHSTAMSLPFSKKTASDSGAQCPDCGKIMSRRADMNRHRKNIHPDGTETKYVVGTILTSLKLIIYQ
jgi:hypothetical protein